MKSNNKTLSSYNHQNTISPSKSITTNPIDKSGLVAKINILGSGINAVKTPHNIVNHHSEKAYGVIDYAGFIKESNEIVAKYKDKRESFNAFHNLFINKFNTIYTAIGIVNEQSGAIEIRLLDKSFNVYSLKVFMSQDDNEIVKAVKNGESVFLENSSFLKLPSFSNLPSLIIPVKIYDKCLCVAIVSDYNLQNHASL